MITPLWVMRLLCMLSHMCKNIDDINLPISYQGNRQENISDLGGLFFIAHIFVGHFVLLGMAGTTLSRCGFGVSGD